MKVLAIEVSSQRRSVAVGCDGAAPVERAQSGGRAVDLFALIESALAEGGLEREGIECIAVGIGPGSYTGLRGAIALAQGWELAGDVRLLGVSSAEVIAAEAAGMGIAGRVCVVIDAQRGEFYIATYELAEGGWKALDVLRLAGREAVLAELRGGALVIGPEVGRWFPEGREVIPGAATLCRMALNRTDFRPGQELEPIYLRETTFVKAPPSRIVD